MPLPLIEVRPVHTFLHDFALQVAAPRSTNPSSTGSGVGGITPWNSWQIDALGGVLKAGYDFLSDRLIFYCRARGSDAGTLLSQGTLVFDSQALDPSAGTFRDHWPTGVIMDRRAGKIYDGQPRLEAGVQTFYSFGNTTGATNEWRTFQLPSLATEASNVFPNFDPEASQEAVDTNPGYYLSTHHRTSAPVVRDLILFEGITDSTGYSEITGGNSHPSGLCLLQTSGGLTLNDPRIDDVDGKLRNAWAWVDIETGNAVGFIDVPINTLGTSDQLSEPNLDGKGFRWVQIQFVPDPDSLDDQPKGELHFFSNLQTAPNDQKPGFFPDGTPFIGIRNYVRVFEFNPFGLQTGRARVHNREIFLGAIDVPHDPITPGGITLLTGGDDRISIHLRYHQPSNTYFLWQGFNINSDTGDPGSPNPLPLAGEFVMYRWRRGFSIDSIAQTPLGEVTTARTVRHLATVLGDFGVPAAGLPITATLRRASTYGEPFTPTSSTDTYQVDAEVIDEDGTLEVWEGDPGTGTLLEEGTDYSVDYSTGTLTGITFTGSSLHHVSYRHRSNELLPAHGTLLSPQSTTDANGIGLFDVRYPDDDTLVGQIDSLTLETA